MFLLNFLIKIKILKNIFRAVFEYFHNLLSG